MHSVVNVLPEQECAEGFLDKQSLQMIVDVARENTTPLNVSVYQLFPEIVVPTYTSMRLNQSGPLRKMIIAAKFNVAMSSGWPQLQIIRNGNNLTFTTNTTEPKPTGYLNVYEYNLTAANFQVKAGDVLNISWYDEREQWLGNRFSLAYQYNTHSHIHVPMVSIIVGDCDSETDLLTLNSLYVHCKKIIEPISTTAGTTNFKNSTSVESLAPTSAIFGGIAAACFLLVIIIILLLVVTCIYVIVIKPRKRFASINTTGENIYIQEIDIASEIDSYLPLHIILTHN